MLDTIVVYKLAARYLEQFSLHDCTGRLNGMPARRAFNRTTSIHVGL
jgi:hypothetical protein